MFSEKIEETRIFILRSPDLYTLQRKIQRLMMQNNIQIRSTIANVHKNPIITLLSGHIVKYSLITVLCIPFSFKNSDKDCLVQVQWTTAHENLEEVVLKVLNLKRYSDFGPIANKRSQTFPLYLNFLCLNIKHLFQVFSSGEYFGTFCWQWDQSQNTFWD